MTNEQFFNTHAKSATVCLVGGTAFVDKTIKKAQKKLTADKKHSLFSHAFLISEKRADDKWWVIESDLEFHRKQVKLGVQENRIDKYFDETMFPNIAILDFNLDAKTQKAVLAEGLNMVAGRANYSLREILGVLWSFTKEERKSENKFSQENSFICSSLVQHCYNHANICFNPEVSLKHMTPEDIYNTKCVHTIEKIIRE
ncbi:MAG: hypothetical protein K0S32_3294 [Bacteroidetes bacterium]|jgi:hypothetical protein|nr:hypothetical protein [Bacteroidota bacterium]